MTCDAAWQCGQVVKMNSSAITLPRYWLRSSWPFPGTVNATSGAFRIAGASVLAANVEAENTNTPMKESSACFKPFSPRFQCSGSLFESFRAFGSGPVASAGAVTAFCDSSQIFFLSNSEGLAAYLLSKDGKNHSGPEFPCALLSSPPAVFQGQHANE